MDSGVLKFVFILIVKDHTVVVHKVENAGLPEGTREKLNNEVVLPFLSNEHDTSSLSCYLDGFCGYYSFFFPNNHSSI